MLLDYVTMNAIAIRKILKKYDKVSESAFTMFQVYIFGVISHIII